MLNFFNPLLRSRPSHIFLLLVSLVLFVSFYIFLEYWELSTEREQISNTTRTILLWNGFFDDERWQLPHDTTKPADLRNHFHCKVFDCIVTNKRNLLRSVDMFNAVLFHIPNLYRRNNFPAVRSPHQFYVFALMESPAIHHPLISSMKNVFNLTMTYRLDSDILWPYAIIEDIKTNTYIAPSRHVEWRQPPMNFNDTELWRLWSMKKRNVAWFVSNCETPSQRERIVKSLQQYIDVDVYGRCANSINSNNNKNNSNHTARCEKQTSACDDLLDREYKFYLAFENSRCTDYVTEKLFDALKRNVIPVVYGGANYTQFAPPRSYINVADFKSVQQLAGYLKYLSGNREEYMKYFWWRTHYKFSVNSVFCRLCEKLHAMKNETHFYADIDMWWRRGACAKRLPIKL